MFNSLKSAFWHDVLHKRPFGVGKQFVIHVLVWKLPFRDLLFWLSVHFSYGFTDKWSCFVKWKWKVYVGSNNMMSVLCFDSVKKKKKKRHIFRLKDWKTGFHPSSSPSVLSAFITVLDQTRVSVSIKLCSLRDDIYVIGQLIFSHCNYRRGSTKYKCGRHTPSFRCLVKSVLNQSTERRTTWNQSW